jgi:hypothetical protein
MPYGALARLTRIALLAHWASDVVVGLAIGAIAERLLRSVTGYDCDDHRVAPSSGGAAQAAAERFPKP